MKLTEKQAEMVKRMQAGDYGVPHITPDAAGWKWKSDGVRMNSSVVHSLWDKKLIDQTYTEDSRMLLTKAGKEIKS